MNRVYANSGSFVAFRGGNMLPVLVRKFEPKPIRASLTSGTDDMVNCAGVSGGSILAGPDGDL